MGVYTYAGSPSPIPRLRHPSRGGRPRSSPRPWSSGAAQSPPGRPTQRHHALFLIWVGVRVLWISVSGV
ncbi:unnamed protein product, partial [Musa acuminata subsp. burmannicoides]